MSYYVPGPGLAVPGLPLDGFTGQILAKASDSDYDTVWVDPPPPSGGGGAGAAYVYLQSAPSAQWIINHNLGYRPSVELLDAGSQEIDGDISHPSINQAVVTLSPPTAGLARLI